MDTTTLFVLLVTVVPVVALMQFGQLLVDRLARRRLLVELEAMAREDGNSLSGAWLDLAATMCSVSLFSSRARTKVWLLENLPKDIGIWRSAPR